MSVLESAIGWLAPPQCIGCGGEGSALCSACSTSGIKPFGARCWLCSQLSRSGIACADCRHAGGPRLVWINTNYEGLSQALVQAYKFGQVRSAATAISGLLVDTIMFAKVDGLLRQMDYLVVPVPTATSRVRQRGFDHSALLAKLLGRKLGLRYLPALGRLGQTRQLGAARTQRLSQTAGNYFVRYPELVAGRNILLIDDVITTGGTIIETAKVLRAAGARRVDAAIFAKRL